MNNHIVRFSRLLRIFNLNNGPAFIIEIEENGQKNLYISYHEQYDYSRHFTSYNKTYLKEEFKDLSYQCLMSQCKDATDMFEKSHISHFKADCSNIVIGDSMFRNSSICVIDTEFPVLENGTLMFSDTKIKEMNIHFPKLKDASNMFYKSEIEKISSQFPNLEFSVSMFEDTKIKKTDIDFPKLKDGEKMFFNSCLEEIYSQFPNLENGQSMFEQTPLKKINCQFFNLKNKKRMLKQTPTKLKEDYPYYFI